MGVARARGLLDDVSHVGEVRHQRRTARSDALVGRPRHRMAEVEQQPAGELEVLRERRRGPDLHAPFDRPFLESAQQPGLADARLAGEQHHAPGARAGGVEPVADPSEQVVAAEHA